MIVENFTLFKNANIDSFHCVRYQKGLSFPPKRPALVTVNYMKMRRCIATHNKLLVLKYGLTWL